MTCIVGVIKDGIVYLGGDSCGADSYGNRQVRKDAKIFKKGEFVLGYTSSYRMGQLIQYNLEIPKITKSDTKDLHKWMVVKFIPALRKCLKDGGYAKIKEGEESGGTFLIGFRGRLFQIENDFQVAEHAEGYDACGCGYAYAMGSLETSRGDTPHRRIEQALAVASIFNGGVSKPFIHINTEKKK